MWNHRIHQRWAGEDLTFWRLAFFPRYDHPEIMKTLRLALQELGVHSYSVYETLGLFDLFVRAWLPSHDRYQAEDKITDALASHSLQLCEVFTVNRILRHWVWDDGAGGLAEPSQEVLTRRSSDDLISRADNGTLPDEDRRRLVEAHVLREFQESPGIKFIVVITSSIYSITYRARLDLERALFDVQEQFNISEPSLYEGTGFGQFILMGRVPVDAYFTLHDLSIAINRTGIQEAIAARPYTFVTSSPHLTEYVDRMPTSMEVSADPVEVRSLLARGEDQSLEIKASARLDWSRYLSGDNQLVRSDRVLNEGLIKALVGLLNTDGGHVILGALEADRVFNNRRAREHPALQTYPQVGSFICVGINDEYGDAGWDKFVLGLQDLINARIEPPPVGAITITREFVDDRDVCVITVKPTQATWYYRYLGEGEPVKFFVREAGRTVAYAGSAADVYKRSRPRG
jgi:hypothetical protein